MLGLDKQGIDKLLLQLEEKQYIDSRYQFIKENNGLKLLGVGGFSYVYEMYDSLAPDKHYAAKVIGLGSKTADEKLVLETAQIQYFLSEQSENVMRVIALWIMKLELDDSGNLEGVIGVNQERYEEAAGFVLGILLMEKLDSIISKDKYGNIELLRDELKSEEGVLRFSENIGKALFSVHNNGFLHRDIKLENIFWDPKSEQYKLGDFGIARFVGEGDAETVVFTDGYGAPEIERHLAESYNLTADIYSLGITMFLLLNELRFPASDGYHANIVQYSEGFVVPAPLNASDEIARIIRKMCSYQVKDRYQSVEEVLMDIGKIDGNYTDQGFTEYEDFETETYNNEDGDSQTETYREFEGSIDNKGELPWQGKEYYELNREERKKILQFENKSYTSSSIWRMIITALLTVFLLKAYSPNALYVERWEFWVLPVAVFIESMLQRVGEFHAEFGFVTIGIAIFSMYYLGIDIPQIAAIIVVIIGVPAITAGFSFGMGLWIAQIITGRFVWLDVFSRWNLGWIVLILFVAVIQSYILLRVDYQKASYYETFIIKRILDNIWYLMIIAGIILLILGHLKVTEIPGAVNSIHLVWTGIGLYIIKVFYLWYYGLLFVKDAKINESLDE